MAKRFAVLVGVTGLLFGVAGAVRSNVSAQTASMAVPMTGSVVTIAGQPVAGAQVILTRHATTAFGSENHETLGSAMTDARGRFSFGPIVVKNELAFPLESSMRLDYAVFTSTRQPLQLDKVTFTAPRNGSAIASISAEIHVH